MSEIYSTAGKCIDKVIARKGTPKSIVFGVKGLKQTKIVYKLVVESLKFRTILEDLLKKTRIQQAEKWLGNGRMLCLAYDFLIGDGIKNKKYEKCFNKYKSQLTNGFTLLKVKHKAKTAADLLPEEVRTAMPKFARVNELVTTLEHVSAELATKFTVTTVNTDKFVETAMNLSEKEVLLDPVLRGVFAFHPKVNLAELELNKKQKLIIQDRASCLPPFVLAPSPGDVVLDCCAAPGNKTHQLAQCVKGGNAPNGKVIACEMDPKRFKLLSQRMDSLGAGKIVSPKLQNFLTIEVNQKPWSEVTKIMLDPSCSGSGMAHRRLLQETDEKDRIEKLAQFQEKALQKAMTFPRAEWISYSTCSTHERENDQVVENAIKAAPGWRHSDSVKRVSGFVKGKQERLSLSLKPFEAATNGFFVALLERNKE